MRYPLRVNTASRCTAAIPSIEVFVDHYDQIVNGRVATALRAKDVDYHSSWQGVTFDDGSVWIDAFDEDAPKVLAFNSSAWRIGALPCDGEPEAKVPQWLTGTWRVTSVAVLQGGQLVPRSPTTWIGKTIDIDVRSGTATLNLTEDNNQQCVFERFATRNSEGPGELSAAFVGLIAGSTTQFLDLTCRETTSRYIERVEVINRTSLAIVGDDKYLLLLRQGKRTANGPKAATTTIGPCGVSLAPCPSGQVCSASRNPAGAIVESCADID
ncbi:MAG TPA: hypothetical protein VIV60_25845 [Polyangiaceae bacterium]